MCIRQTTLTDIFFLVHTIHKAFEIINLNNKIGRWSNLLASDEKFISEPHRQSVIVSKRRREVNSHRGQVRQYKSVHPEIACRVLIPNDR